jgi:hypothetical protein
MSGVITKGYQGLTFEDTEGDGSHSSSDHAFLVVVQFDCCSIKREMFELFIEKELK